MVRSSKSGRKVLKVPPLPVRPAFRREFLDFERGIRMGGLEPNERITQILKHALVQRHGCDFLIDKWGRGRYWQWICWIARPNLAAKPISGGLSFSCAKFFISLERDERTLEAGLQIERAYVARGRRRPNEVYAAEDWDFYRLVESLRKGTPLAAELARLVTKDGFTAHVGGPESGARTFRGRRWGGVAAVRRACRRIPGDSWGWFQAYYAIPEKEIREMDGSEIVATILAIFGEVAPLMNLVMTEPFLANPKTDLTTKDTKKRGTEG